ncbi:hypothetical protein [Paracoccus sp. JM45]|nr:hypothetical protein [Paracoccus sp. JM45]
MVYTLSGHAVTLVPPTSHPTVVSAGRQTLIAGQARVSLQDVKNVA